VRTDVDSLVTRIPGSVDFIRIDPAKCTLCGRCLVVCTMNLWRKKGNKVHIADDYKSKCLECGACYQVCESDAIDFRYPSGGKGVVYERG
jgi:ferredoxin-like protein FixX